MKTFTNYALAYNYAVSMANTHNRDMGLFKAREFGSVVYQVKMLPNRENRYGHELTCEVVRPGQPAMA